VSTLDLNIGEVGIVVLGVLIAFTGAEVAMKLVVGVILFFWLLCGLVGAWMLDELDAGHWKKIAWGPITLHEALNEHPVAIPTQN
jgi:hypothetical protein